MVTRHYHCDCHLCHMCDTVTYRDLVLRLTSEDPGVRCGIEFNCRGAANCEYKINDDNLGRIELLECAAAVYLLYHDPSPLLSVMMREWGIQ